MRQFTGSVNGYTLTDSEIKEAFLIFEHLTKYARSKLNTCMKYTFYHKNRMPRGQANLFSFRLLAAYVVRVMETPSLISK